MRKMPRWLMTASVILIVAFAQTLPAKASPKQDALTLTPAEQYVRDALQATGKADLLDFSKDPNDHILRGAFILQLWSTDPDIQKIANFEIDNAVIEGDIEAQGLTIPFNVELQNCTFNGGLNLASTTTKTFRLDGSTVTGPVKMGRMVVNGDLALYQSTFEGEVTLFGADISKNLFARDSKFNGVMPDPSSKYPFELWTTHVGQTTEFTNAVFKGEVIADDAQFGVNLNFDHTVFEKLATFQDVRVGNLANFQGATFKNTVTFESSIMNRDASFTGATFNGSANFDYVSVTRFFDFDKTTLNNSFSIQYSTIGWPYFESATLDGKVNFEGIQASNDLDFTNATYSFLTEPFTIELAKVDGRAKFPGFSAPAGVSLAHNQFGTLNISGRDGQKYAFINLDSTQVAGDFLLENITTDEFSAQGFVANGSTTFQQVAVANKLDFSNASLGVFTLDKEFWPKNPDAFNLRAMTFNDIIVSPELNEDTWPKLLNMVTESAYSPQAYRTLEDFLTEKGHPDWAADVELDRKIRERDHILAPRTGPWFWSWFLFIFSGYGQRPQYAFGWSLLVIVIGAIVFWKEDNLVMLEESEAKPPYNRWLYSFALFIPYIELGIAEKWDPKPEHKAAWMYKYVHKMLGWILTPIALLTFGGIIK